MKVNSVNLNYNTFQQSGRAVQAQVNPTISRDKIGVALPRPSEPEVPFSLKLSNFWNTIVMGGKGIFHINKAPDLENNVQKKWQRTLLKIFPGETVMGPLAKVKRTTEDKNIPTAPVFRQINPQKFMPNLVFTAGEDSFPVRADFDNDGNVNNNYLNYRHGVFSEQQKPAVYTNVVKKGEYTVLSYWLYYVDNKYSNYHHHDWQKFSVYLKEDKFNNLQPEYFLSHWHHAREIVPWSELKKDSDGRPYLYIGRGSHGALPYRHNEEIPRDNGFTFLSSKEVFQNRSNKNQQYLTGLTYLSENRNLTGTELPEILNNGDNVLNYQKYFHDETILGFIPTGKKYEGGPATSSNYTNPYHPSLFKK